MGTVARVSQASLSLSQVAASFAPLTLDSDHILLSEDELVET